MAIKDEGDELVQDVDNDDNDDDDEVDEEDDDDKETALNFLSNFFSKTNF